MRPACGPARMGHPNSRSASRTAEGGRGMRDQPVLTGPGFPGSFPSHLACWTLQSAICRLMVTQRGPGGWLMLFEGSWFMDYKTTLNLPKTDFPMRANLPEREPELLREWETLRLYDTLRAVRSRTTAVGPARWAALCQRSHPHGPCPQQDPQGHDREIPVHVRLRCAVRAGLGLPRVAHRASGGPGAGPARPARCRSRRSGSSVARTLRDSLTSSGRSSSGWGPWGTGATHTERWSTPTRRTSFGNWESSSARAPSIEGSSRCTGALRALPRWRRLRSSTKTTFRLRSTWLSR